MSTLYDALKKAENKNKANLPVKNQEKIPLWVIVLSGVLAILVVVKLAGVKRTHSAQAKAKTAQKKSALPAAAPQVLPEKKYDGYVLEGIIYNQGYPTAIINGKILRKNEKIDDLEVKDISPDKVELLNLKNNTTTILNL